MPEWQKNQMITFEVTDLDVYWSELEQNDLAGSFPGVRLRPPTQFPWGPRSTSSIQAESAGIYGRLRVRQKSCHEIRNSRQIWWGMRAACSLGKTRCCRV